MKHPSTKHSSSGIPETWPAFALAVMRYPFTFLQTRYSQWIKAMVLQRVEYLAKLEASAHKDSFVSASQALYTLARETESPAEKAAKQAWENLQQQHRLQLQGQAIAMEVRGMYDAQQAIQQRIRANSVARTAASGFGGF